MIKLVIDCFGGDHSPQANVAGALEALERLDDLYLILTGDEEKIHAELAGRSYDTARLEVVHAPDVIGCDEKPTDAIRMKKESSMMRAVYLLRTRDDIAGMVSNGSTGALVAASVLRIGRLDGVIRPAFCPILPSMAGGIVAICDSGANVECNAEELRQFAVMGSLYLSTVYRDKLPQAQPRVALLNVGVEAEKGDSLRREAYALLAEMPDLHFVGNMESRDLLSGNYDLVVCDGFAGNVLIKSTEGACLEMLKLLKKDISSSFRNKIGALILRKMFLREKQLLDYQNYGGSVMLGTQKIVVKGHGSSKQLAVRNCVEQAYRMAKVDLCGMMEEELRKTRGLSAEESTIQKG